MNQRQELQQSTRRTDAQTVADAVASTKRGEPADQLQLAAVMAWIAYSCPDATTAVYDNITSAWLGHKALIPRYHWHWLKRQLRVVSGRRSGRLLTALKKVMTLKCLTGNPSNWQPCHIPCIN